MCGRSWQDICVVFEYLSVEIVLLSGWLTARHFPGVREFVPGHCLIQSCWRFGVWHVASAQLPRCESMNLPTR